jgi:hypothetical protein
MTSFDLLINDIEDTEALIKWTKAKLKESFSFRIKRQPDKVKLNTSF